MDYLTYDVVVIGSGAAGFNAANRIKQNSGLSVAILTEDRNAGTSRNTGSDKQTRPTACALWPRSCSPAAVWTATTPFVRRHFRCGAL